MTTLDLKTKELAREYQAKGSVVLSDEEAIARTYKNGYTKFLIWTFGNESFTPEQISGTTGIDLGVVKEYYRFWFIGKKYRPKYMAKAIDELVADDLYPIKFPSSKIEDINIIASNNFYGGTNFPNRIVVFYGNIEYLKILKTIFSNLDLKTGITGEGSLRVKKAAPFNRLLVSLGLPSILEDYTDMQLSEEEVKEIQKITNSLNVRRRAYHAVSIPSYITTIQAIYSGMKPSDTNKELALRLMEDYAAALLYHKLRLEDGRIELPDIYKESRAEEIARQTVDLLNCALPSLDIDYGSIHKHPARDYQIKGLFEDEVVIPRIRLPKSRFDLIQDFLNDFFRRLEEKYGLVIDYNPNRNLVRKVGKSFELK